MAKQKTSAEEIRNLSPEARAARFMKARKEEKPDYQVLTSDWVDELIPYGLITFDYVLGLGGISRHGRVSQVHGDEGVGKSTLTYVIAKNYQQFTGEPLGIFDFEGTGTPSYLEKIGANLDLVKLIQPDSMEDSVIQTLDLLDQGCRFFIYDSIPDIQPLIDVKDIRNKKAFKASYGKHAQVMGKFFQALQPHMKKHDGHMFMINQTRARIDDSMEAKYANDYSYTNKTYNLPGGRICRFKPSTMIELRIVKAVPPLNGKGTSTKETPDKDPFIVPWETPATAGKMLWNRVRARTLKNKVTGAGYREGFIWVQPGVGINDNMSVRELARAYDFITNKGAKWFVGKSAEDAIIAYPNKDAAVEDLVVKENPEVHQKLRELLADAITNDSENRHASSLTAEEIEMVEGDGLDAVEEGGVESVGQAFETDEL